MVDRGRNLRMSKRTIELIANNSKGATELKKALSERGFNVNHIYTGCLKPMLIEDGYLVIGSGNIRAIYLPQ